MNETGNNYRTYKLLANKINDYTQRQCENQGIKFSKVN